MIVATIRALKMHGGVDKKNLAPENLEALEKGLPNLLRHVDNIKNVYKLPGVVALNRFPTDTDAEIDMVIRRCKELGVNTVLSTVWADGGVGGVDLADEVIRLCDEESNEDFSYLYELDEPIEKKIRAICKRVYRASHVAFTKNAEKEIQRLTSMGYGGLPICIAKTQYSFSDEAHLIGAPEGFVIHVQNVRLSAGAGFIVALTGAIMTMPGLPKSPAAERIDVNDDGVISGLF